MMEWEGSLLIMRRTEREDDPWSGHFSFPGGKCEPADRTLAHAACREVFEEVGVQIDPQSLQSAGPRINTQLNHIKVQPFYIPLPEKPTVKIDPAEVAYTRWVPRKILTEDAYRRIKAIHPRDPDRLMNCIPLDDYYIWGVTLAIIDACLIGEQ